MKRRDIVKSLSLLPFAGSVLPVQSLLGAARPAGANGVGPLAAWGAVPGSAPGAGAASGTSLAAAYEAGAEIYQSIGVEPVINCIGTFTIIGGSVQRAPVRAAMDAASQHYVQLDELAAGVGQRLADLTGAEWGIVSSGCTAGLKLVTAACVSGGNPEKLIRIPDLTGFDKTEVIIPTKGRNPYDHSIRNIGVKIINVDTLEELEQAIGPRTALIEFMTGDWMASGQPMSLENISKIARARNIPVLVDAAAEMLTVPNVHLQAGATVVAYSGGKALCGPQCAGLLIGRKDLLMAAWQASSPHHGPARDNKVGREEHIGLLAAVEEYLKRDHAAEEKVWMSWLHTIESRLSGIPGVKTLVRDPKGINNRSSSLVISWDAAKLNVTGQEVQEELGHTKPRIAVGVIDRLRAADASAMEKVRNLANGAGDDTLTGITIVAWMMQPGNDKVVADRIFEVLSRKRSANATVMKAPAADLTGRWEADIEFAISKSRHILEINKQDGNWIEGSHTGDFTSREMVGSIDGDEVKLRSDYRIPGDTVTFIFSGKVSGDTLSGIISMGEYLFARFTAKRYSYKNGRKAIKVPTGPPLMG